MRPRFLILTLYLTRSDDTDRQSIVVCWSSGGGVEHPGSRFRTVPGLLQREADRFVENRVLSDNKGNSDRTAKLRDSRPLHLQPSPRGVSLVNISISFGSLRGCRHAGSPFSRANALYLRIAFRQPNPRIGTKAQLTPR